MDRREKTILATAMLVGLALLVYYTRYLFREELREWDEIRVEFTDVGGLKQNDEVQVEGQTLGRVKKVDLYLDRQVATFQLIPGVELRQDYSITIVPKNAIGQMVVRIKTGSPGQQPVVPGELLTGEVFQGLGGGESTPGRRRDINKLLEDLATSTRLAQDPETGVVGRLLFDEARKDELEQALDELEQSWADIDASLAQVDAGAEGVGALTVSGEALWSFRDTIARFRDVFGDMQRSLTEADRGEGTAGKLLGDPAFARSLEQTIARQNAFFRATRRGEGLLGQLNRPEVHESLVQTTTALKDQTEAASDDRGLLGVLSSPTYDEHVRGGLRNFSRSTELFNESPILRSELVRDAMQDGGGDLHDLVIEMERAVRFIDRNLPARRSFQGAVFAIF